MKDKITITRKDLALAVAKSMDKVTEQIKQKTNKPEVSLVSSLYGLLLTAQLTKDLFDDSKTD